MLLAFEKSSVLKILTRSPSGFVVVRNASDFDSRQLFTEQPITLLHEKLLHFVKLKIMSTAISDLLQAYLKEFDKKYWLLDFYWNCLDNEYYKELSFVLKTILVLSHCQAAVGRRFNLKKVLTVSIVDYFKGGYWRSHGVYSSAQQKYKIALEKQRNKMKWNWKIAIIKTSLIISE